MSKYTTRKWGRVSRRAAAVLAGSLGLALLPLTAHAQINRSRPPQQPAGPPPQAAPPVTIPAPRAPIYGDNDPLRLPSTPYNRPQFQTGPGQGQNGLDFNSLFSRPTAPGYSFGGLRVLTNTPGQSAADRLNGARRGSISPIQPNPPNEPGDILFGGRVGGSRNYEPSRGEDLLFGGNVTVPPDIQRANRERFRKSLEGFIYFNGIRGRHHHTFYYGWGDYYFPGGAAYYPFYYPTYIDGLTLYSPYAYYYGVLPAFISLNNVYYTPPRYIYVPVPVYNNYGGYQGWRTDDVDDYYLNRERKGKDDTKPRGDDYRIGEKESKNDKSVEAAADDIRKAWQNGDIELLAKHIRRDSRIAVYLRGKYQYSLDAGDYLDMTRDAFQTTKTIRVELDNVKKKENDVYTLTGRHVYRSKDGQQRTVFISFVLEKMDDNYIITQVGTAPDQIEE
ncbi:MAG TPA: hypothetical protein VFB21_17980 [Chthonomonadaceae bacterium]|nr:hypothetical protein [Chthonomonadaceae bacterium]